MLGELAQSLAAAYRELAARLREDTPASVDEDGKLHVAALSAVPDPPSLIDPRRRSGRSTRDDPAGGPAGDAAEGDGLASGVHRVVHPRRRHQRSRR
ncbi:hypothetical protein OH799_03750 [Nocardia sp. NBC_00881]|uniref:hypothetical protein n=1 Tax=Nocardia sp. NBC_00881 TaxID=2975995 RepID=UPI003867296D|nr:hypothetical protein OH799_03750 [Nocardia sp. NBC_00881]